MKNVFLSYSVHIQSKVVTKCYSLMVKTLRNTASMQCASLFVVNGLSRSQCL